MTRTHNTSVVSSNFETTYWSFSCHFQLMLINVAFSVCLRSTFQSDVYYQSPFPAVPCYVQKQLKLKGVLTTSVSSRRPCLMQQFCQSGITKIEVLFVWPGDAIYARVFCRYLRHLLSDLKDNFTTEFSEFFYVGRMNKIRNPFFEIPSFWKTKQITSHLWRDLSQMLVHIETQKEPLCCARFPSELSVCTKISYCRLCAGYQKNRRFLALAPPTLKIYALFHDSRVRYPDICVCHWHCEDPLCIKLELRSISGVLKGLEHWDS